MKTAEAGPEAARTWIARAFTILEDVVYVALGLVLGASALVLLFSEVVDFVHSLAAGTFSTNIVELLDRILLILLIVELLYTVQVSFKAHALLPEPFLIVGLIAAIRRVLVLTAQIGHGPGPEGIVNKDFFIELAVLTGLILVIAVSLVLVRKRSQKSVETAAKEPLQ